MERKVLRTLDEVINFMDSFSKIAFAFDTETTSLSYYDLQIEGISFCDGNKACYIYLVDNEEAGRILHYLYFNVFKKAGILIAHNIVYDLKVLQKYGMNLENKELFDTMVADHLLDENKSHKLKDIAAELLEASVITYEEARKNGTNTQVFFDYATNDAVWTWDIAMRHRESLAQQGMEKLFRDIEMPFQHVLVEMAVNGVDVDIKKVRKTTKQLRNKIVDLEIEMLECIEEPYTLQTNLMDGSLMPRSRMNFNSTQHLSKLLFTRLGLDIVETTPSGAPSVGIKTITTLKDAHPFVDLLHKYKTVNKLLSAFFEPLPEHVTPDNKVRPNFRDTGTKTGRLSCTKPNLQQLPKQSKQFKEFDSRACFIAPEGYKMVTCDYAGQELRVLTEISKEPVLIETFIKGKDMHLSTANDFFELGIPDEALYSNHPDCSMYKEKFKNERNKAKTINFGMAYGKGAYGFSKDFGITEQDAQGILDKYFAALPRVKKAIDDAHSSVRNNGYVTSLTGRRRRFSKIVRGDWEGYPSGAFRQSFNFLIQGFSADMIRMAAVASQKLARANPEWDLKAVATVHDEIVYIVKEDYVDVAGKGIKEAFEGVVDFCIPIVADIEVGINYSEAK